MLSVTAPKLSSGTVLPPTVKSPGRNPGFNAPLMGVMLTMALPVQLGPLAGMTTWPGDAGTVTVPPVARSIGAVLPRRSSGVDTVVVVLGVMYAMTVLTL